MAILHPECQKCGMKHEFDTNQKLVKEHFEIISSMNVFCPYCGSKVATLTMEPTLTYPEPVKDEDYLVGLEALFG